MTTSTDTQKARLEGWCQTPTTRLVDAKAAVQFIEDVGLATVYPASTEVADLFHAHVGDPDAKTEMKWDSPSGTVYGWRWEIGKADAALYGTVVRKRPTFVRWSLAPAIIRLVGDLRTPDELLDLGVISQEAHRIAEVLEASELPLETGAIRAAAGFPQGKAMSANYHKALEELSSRMLITVEFPASSELGIKHHGLMYKRHREIVDAAGALSYDQAISDLLDAYLPTAQYVDAKVLARHLRIDSTQLQERLAILPDSG